MAKVTAETQASWVEFCLWEPILDVLYSVTTKGRDWEEDEIIGEQIAEIGAERALAGNPYPMDDARRIWLFQARDRALRSYASKCKDHRVAALALECAATLNI